MHTFCHAYTLWYNSLPTYFILFLAQPWDDLDLKNIFLKRTHRFRKFDYCTYPYSHRLVWTHKEETTRKRNASLLTHQYCELNAKRQPHTSHLGYLDEWSRSNVNCLFTFHKNLPALAIKCKHFYHHTLSYILYVTTQRSSKIYFEWDALVNR